MSDQNKTLCTFVFTVVVLFAMKIYNIAKFFLCAGCMPASCAVRQADYYGSVVNVYFTSFFLLLSNLGLLYLFRCSY